MRVPIYPLGSHQVLCTCRKDAEWVSERWWSSEPEGYCTANFRVGHPTKLEFYTGKHLMT